MHIISTTAYRYVVVVVVVNLAITGRVTKRKTTKKKSCSHQNVPNRRRPVRKKVVLCFGPRESFHTDVHHVTDNDTTPTPAHLTRCCARQRLAHFPLLSRSSAVDAKKDNTQHNPRKHARTHARPLHLPCTRVHTFPFARCPPAAFPWPPSPRRPCLCSRGSRALGTRPRPPAKICRPLLCSRCQHVAQSIEVSQRTILFGGKRLRLLPAWSTKSSLTRLYCT